MCLLIQRLGFHLPPHLLISLSTSFRCVRVLCRMRDRVDVLHIRLVIVGLLRSILSKTLRIIRIYARIFSSKANLLELVQGLLSVHHKPRIQFPPRISLQVRQMPVQVLLPFLQPKLCPQLLPLPLVRLQTRVTRRVERLINLWVRLFRD